MITDQQIDIFLEHHGVKGMKWGVRKEEVGSSKNSDSEKSTRKYKRAAIILGSVAAVGAISAGAIYAKHHMNLKVKDLPKPSESAKKFTETMAKEPVDIIHAARGQNRGHVFLRGGGLKNSLEEYDKSGLAQHQGSEFFNRYGDRNEKVAARFVDPLGRKDHARRPILHDVILPESMAKDVHNVDDVKKKVWETIKDLYGAYYRGQPGTAGPGY